jgi:hypothetical protein
MSLKSVIILQSEVRINIYSQMERTGGEGAVIYFQVLVWHYSSGTIENHEILYSQ